MTPLFTKLVALSLDHIDVDIDMETPEDINVAKPRQDIEHYQRLIQEQKRLAHEIPPTDFTDAAEHSVTALPDNCSEELRELHALGLSPHAIRKLTAKSSTLSFEEQIDCISSLIRVSKQLTESAKDKDLVIIMGPTGVGKGSTINYISGCKMKLVPPEEVNAKGIEDRIIVDPNSQKKAVVAVGHSKKSDTVVPKPIDIGDRFLCDTPGFFENRGTEINIANAVNMVATFSMARSVRIVCLIRASSAEGKASVIVDMAHHLKNMVGDTHKASVLFGLTNLGTETNPRKIRSLIEGICDPEEIPDRLESNFFERLENNFIPIYPNNEDQRTELLDRISALPQIDTPRDLFHVTLTPQDISLLEKMARHFERQFFTAIEDGDIDTIIDKYQEIKQLDAIQNETVTSILDDLKKKILEKIESEKKDISALLISKEPADYVLLKTRIQAFEKFRVLDDALDGILVSPIVDTLLAQIREVQEREQQDQNTSLQDKLTILQSRLQTVYEHYATTKTPPLSLSDFESETFQNMPEVLSYKNFCQTLQDEQELRDLKYAYPQTASLTNMLKEATQYTTTQQQRGLSKSWLTFLKKEGDALLGLLAQHQTEIVALSDINESNQPFTFSDLKTTETLAPVYERLSVYDAMCTSPDQNLRLFNLTDEFDDIQAQFQERKRDMETQLTKSIYAKKIQERQTTHATLLTEMGGCKDEILTLAGTEPLTLSTLMSHPRATGMPKIGPLLNRLRPITPFFTDTAQAAHYSTLNLTAEYAAAQQNSQLHIVNFEREINDAISGQKIPLLTTTINNVLANVDRLETRVADISACLDELKTLHTEIYEEELREIQATITPLYDASQIQTWFENGDYAYILKRITTLQAIAATLHGHITLTDLQGPITKLSALIEACYSKIQTELQDPENITQLTSLRAYIAAIQTFQPCLDTMGKTFPSIASITNMVCETDPTKTLLQDKQLPLGSNIQDYAKAMAKIITLSELLESTDMGITWLDAYIGKLPEDTIASLGNLFNSWRSDPDLSKVSNEIIAGCPQFEKLLRLIANQKASAVNFETALSKIETHGADTHRATTLTSAKKTVFGNAYKKFQEVFNDIIDDVLKPENRTPEGLERAENQNREAIARLKETYKSRPAPVRNIELVARILAQWSLTYSASSFVSGDKASICYPYPTQVLAIIQALGLAGDTLIDRLSEVKTGEGKSVILATMATYLALIGYDVDVVCYSAYLTQRDHDTFRKLFRECQVANQIAYKTIGDITNRYFTDKVGDIRAISTALVTEANTPLRNSASSRPVAMLIDEVDVFFGSKFYGQTYNATARFREADSTNLVRWVWNNRSTLPDASAASIEKVTQTKEYRNLCRKYKKAQPLITQQIKKMLQSLQAFNSIPISHDYEVAHNEIVYRNDTGSVSSAIYHGYSSQFAYLKECQPGGRIQNPAVYEHLLGIEYNSGHILYSEMPNLVDLKIGITGSLACLSSYEKNILSQYNFRESAYIPSTFAKKELQIESTEVYGGDRAADEKLYVGYFANIKKDLIEKRTAGRASLCIFKNKAALNEFLNYLGTHPMEGKPPIVLMEEDSHDTRQRKIANAATRDTITLMIKQFGRGSDFICYDSELLNNGGCHVLQTFPASLKSLDVQIEGRTGRQDNPGSYKCIFFIDDLAKFGATDRNEMENSGLSWDEFIDQKRETVRLSNKFDAITRRLEKNKEKHEQTLRYCRDYKQGHYDAAYRGLMTLNVER